MESRGTDGFGLMPVSLSGSGYRLASGVAGAVLPLLMRGEDGSERLARRGPEVTPGGIWIHGASVGELNSARALIADLAEDMPVIVTANSVTGRAAAQGWGLPACLAPLDVPGAVGRFLDRVRPRVQMTIENEIWPNRARLLAARGVAQVVVGARMSERSARRWARLPGLIRPVLSRIAVLSAQNAATEARLLALGLPPAALSGRLQLKLLAPARVVPQDGGPWRDLTVLAASTHEGEEEVILDAYLAARAEYPALRLILAPRHPARADQVVAIFHARGLDPARRSRGGDESAPVLLADTLGEMARWYDRAAICVTGGSFTDRGGHTPWEPAAHRCAILRGPHIANFAEDYAALDAAGASRAISAGDLARALQELARDGAACAGMGARARALLLERAGDPGPLLAAINALADARA